PAPLLSPPYSVPRLLSCHPSPAVLPSLLSFPTRRSSDLVQVHAVLGGPLRPRLEIQLEQRPGPRGVTQGARRDPGGFLPAAHPGDRKSTRLNSSHVSISYAVFCLKTKNANIRSTVNSDGT